ncbi:hypothetical protein [Desulfitobacterium hafniense]|uniref:hypothetical protein n=1 Tax=Desulfitobacterium hafniense TaxID=49338 RepID=UPI000375768E|nr:hypothetical protein [Desulfitobacterium hafniense]
MEEELLRQILTQLQGLTSEVQAIKDSQGRVESALSILQYDVGHLEKDVNDIKRDLGHVWIDIKHLDNCLEAQREKVDKLILYKK